MDKIDSEIISKYLIRNYPVKRIKDGRRFKRSIRIFNTRNGKTNVTNIFLKSKTDKFILRKHLIADLSMVFGFPTTMVESVISNYIGR
jgi:hypothetical protein